jgi:hypothetical protein
VPIVQLFCLPETWAQENLDFNRSLLEAVTAEVKFREEQDSFVWSSVIAYDSNDLF